MQRTPFRLAAVLALLGPLSAFAAGSERFTRVEAFLKTHCIECHGGKSKKADLTLNVYHDEPSILQDRKVWERALEMVREGEMPPSKRPQPSETETASFLHGVEAIFDDADRTAKPDPGRVTVRRLNRTEYNNTIRDLMGVDFTPADDFPSDDIGHGFDNIGDVLSISPVLMERYLAAAENVVNRAILVELPKPRRQRTAGRDLRGQGRGFGQQQFQGRYRPLTAGTLTAEVRASLPGDHTVRLKAYAPLVDGKPARVALLLDDQEFKQFDVSGGGEQNPLTLETALAIPPGTHRLTISLLNPTPDKPSASTTKPATAPAKRTVQIQSIEVEDPADTRPLSQRALLAYSPAAKTRPQQTREILTRFANRAYRRPATPDEVQRLMALVARVESSGEKWEAGIQMAMQAVLSSPKFLFRVELDDRPQSLEPHPLSEYQLASRLSYFIWQSMPDDELFALAAKNQLTANLDAQVRRMLKDPRSKSLVDGFAIQWLQLRRLRSIAPDGKTFPTFDENLRASMQIETELFLDAVIKEDRSVLELIDADFTFLNGTLARHYGLPDPTRNGGGGFGGRRFGQTVSARDFVRVSLPKDGPRGGLLTQASILTVTSNPTRTSPVKRGRWVLEQILGAPPPPPPPDVPELKEDAKAQLTGSLRQRMEQHRENPACASCHAKMDPLGFAFENFDGVGAFRKKDGEFVIDPSGTLPDGKSFKGPAELRTILMEKKGQFAKCLTEKMMTYALGRGVQFYDRRAVNKILAALEKDDYKFSRLVIEIARSDPFRLRRGTEQQVTQDKLDKQQDKPKG
jgi:mono/diheme cytochrome c family protein